MCLSLLFVTLISITYIFSSISSTVDETSFDQQYVSTLRQSTKSSSNSKNNVKPLGILLIGTDDSQFRSESEGARSDTLIYITINPHTKRTKMYSISRDLYAWTDDHTYQKINAAYSIGKEAQTAKAVERFLNAPVDHYISVNMDVLVDTVNAIKGISVYNPFEFPISISDQEPLYTATIDPGHQHVDGDQALVFARMRYQDPEGDVGRQRRQQEVIKAIISKLKTGSLITSYHKLLNVVEKNINTTVRSSQLKSLISSYSTSLNQIESTSIIGRGEMIGNTYYMVAGYNNLLNIQNEIRNDLELETVESIEDTHLLTVDDSYLDLDPGIHYDFNQ